MTTQTRWRVKRRLHSRLVDMVARAFIQPSSCIGGVSVSGNSNAAMLREKAAWLAHHCPLIHLSTSILTASLHHSTQSPMHGRVANEIDSMFATYSHCGPRE